MQDHQIRRVRLNGTHPAKVTPSWYGDSIGHYEGDTLVVDTVGYKLGPAPVLDMYGSPFSEGLHVTERYRLIDYEAAKAAQERNVRDAGRSRPSKRPPSTRTTKARGCRSSSPSRTRTSSTRPGRAPRPTAVPPAGWRMSAPRTRTNTTPEKTRRSQRRIDRISERGLGYSKPNCVNSARSASGSFDLSLAFRSRGASLGSK